MTKKSLNNTFLINIGAFILVVLLEIMSGWVTRDNFDTNYPQKVYWQDE